MELRHLRYFVAVAEALSFRGAAERLGMAQPPLSAQIKGLEQELGVKLLARTTRSVQLTAAGRVFLEEARAVLAASAQAEQRVRQAGSGQAGTLRLGLIASMANAWVAGVLRSFRRGFPGVQLSLYELTSTEQLRRLRARELDAGLLRPPVSFPELDSRLVWQSSQVLALPVGHRLERKRPLDWQDFHREKLVLIQPPLQHGFYDAFFAECARAGAQPGPIHYANDIQTKLWLVSAGFGLAPISATLAEIKRPGLRFRPLPPGLPPIQAVLAWRRDDTSPALRHFCAAFPAPPGPSEPASRPHKPPGPMADRAASGRGLGNGVDRAALPIMERL